MDNTDETIKDENVTVRLADMFLVGEKTAAKLCGIGKSLFRQLNADGSVPACYKLHSKNMWSRRELAIWVNMGCPPRNSELWQNVLKSIKNEPEKYL